ncbi:MAG: hypothetical protein ABW075_12240 [Aeromicrobium sp.]
MTLSSRHVDGVWLPTTWTHPSHVPVTATHHLRPVRATDVDLDLQAVLATRERLWATYGPVWGWPPADLDRARHHADLARNEVETAAQEAFTYALFDTAETQVLGGVYVDPPEKHGADAEISWWVVDELLESECQVALDAFVPAWVAADWPFTCPRYVGRDLSWQTWLDLPDLIP